MKIARLVLALVAAAVIVFLVATVKSAVDLGAPPFLRVASDPWTYVEAAVYGVGIWLVTEIGVAASSKRRRQAQPKGDRDQELTKQ